MPRILRILAFGMALCIATPLLGQFNQPEPFDAKDTRLSYESLKQHAQAGRKITNCKVSGIDLVLLISSTGHGVHLDSCVVTGGLTLKGLEVRSGFSIQRSIIEPIQSGVTSGYSLIINDTKFLSGAVSLKETIIDGRVDIRNTTIESDFSFEKATFSNITKFKDVLHGGDFKPRVNFSEATFVAAVFFENVTLLYPDFRQAVFRGRFEFTIGKFLGAAFDGVTFIEKVSFKEVEFSLWSSFRDVTFRDKVKFERVNFRSTSFAKAKFIETPTFTPPEKMGLFRGGVSFEETQFERGLQLANSHIVGGANFKGARFCEPQKGLVPRCPISFQNTRFDKDVTFEKAQFFYSANFKGSDFQDLVTFSGASFSNADFANAILKKADFRGTEGWGLYFTGTRSAGEVLLGKSKWEQVLVTRSEFSSGLTFRNGVFREVTLEQSDFGPVADFRDAEVTEVLSVVGRFEASRIDLRESRISLVWMHNADNPALIPARVDFRGARIRALFIDDTTFTKTVSFRGAILGEIDQFSNLAKGGVVLRSVTFEERADFSDAKLRGALVLDGVQFVAKANWDRTQFFPASGGAVLQRLNFGKVSLQWQQVPPLAIWTDADDRAAIWSRTINVIQGRAGGLPRPSASTWPDSQSDVYRKLELTYEQVGRIADRNEAYYARKLAERREAKGSSGEIWLTLEWLGWGVVHGYGTRLMRIVFVLFVFLMSFSCAFLLLAKVERRKRDDIKPDHAIRLRLLDLPQEVLDTPDHETRLRRNLQQFREQLWLSSLLLVKVGPRDLEVRVRCNPRLLQFLIHVEWILGYYLLAAFIVTLTTTQPVLNRLVSSLF